jgi:hypothetical protein
LDKGLIMSVEVNYLREYLATRKSAYADRVARVEKYRRAVAQGLPIPYVPRPKDGRGDNTPLSLRILELGVDETPLEEE